MAAYSYRIHYRTAHELLSDSSTLHVGDVLVIDTDHDVELVELVHIEPDNVTLVGVSRKNTQYCNLCGKTVYSGTALMRCEECDFDVCGECQLPGHELCPAKHQLTEFESLTAESGIPLLFHRSDIIYRLQRELEEIPDIAALIGDAGEVLVMPPPWWRYQFYGR